jgi:regulator of protease activity HflC (stomatin/prohibitin superfamily)
MRLIFGTFLVLAGLLGATALGRMAPRQTGEFAVAGGLKALRLLAYVLIPIGALVILSSGIRMISAGQVGVALLFGKVAPVALHEGLNLVNPLYDVVQMDTRVLKHQARYDAASKDLQAVHVEMVVNYRLTPDKAT